MAVPPLPPPDMTAEAKRALRARMRADRDAFVAGGPSPILVPDAFRERLTRGLTVTSYVPIGSEADPSPFARIAMEAGCALALPHVTVRAEPMRFLASDAGTALEPGPFGLSQPPGHAAELVPDIILTPLLAFDAGLNRLGQGAGYYDRAFARYPAAWRVGIAWSMQHVSALSIDSWDVPLHAIATERGWIVR